LDSKFRVYLLDVFRKTLYGLGEERYEKKKELLMGKDALQNKKAYLKELDKLADELSKRAVTELEALGVKTPDDLLTEQGLVKEKLGVVQSVMEKELSK
jgi:hypothetical protein